MQYIILVQNYRKMKQIAKKVIQVGEKVDQTG